MLDVRDNRRYRKYEKMVERALNWMIRGQNLQHFWTNSFSQLFPGQFSRIRDADRISRRSGGQEEQDRREYSG